MTMIRKAGVLTLLSVAMAAAWASAAAAAEFKSEAYPVRITGAQTTHEFTLGGRAIKCSTSRLEGEPTKDAASWKLFPSYTNCVMTFGSVAVKVTGTKHYGEKEGCGFLFNLGATNTIDIECEGTSQILMDAGPCKFRIQGQKGLKDFSYKNEGKDAGADILLTMTLTGISYTIEAASEAEETACKALLDTKHSPGGSYVDGVYNGSSTIKGEDLVDEGEIGITIA